MTPRGLFITFEGPEGAGKSTQARRLWEYLETNNPGNTVLTREPGGTALAEELRAIIKHYDGEEIDNRTEVLLVEAGRAQHVARVIAPALAAGRTVLCDRFTDSTLAYQGAGRGGDESLLRALNDYATAGVAPDLTFLLDLPSETGLARAAFRGPERKDATVHGDRMESLALDFHRRLRKHYLELAQAESGRFRILNAEQGVEELSRQVIAEYHAFIVR